MITSPRRTNPLPQLWDRLESATIVRLGRSRHVADLRLIFWTTIVMMVAAVAAVAGVCVLRPGTGTSAVSSCIPLIAAVGATGFGVLTWTYQSGSARLGIVDLFACEITTLCRVAIVVDMVQRQVDQFDSEPTTHVAVQRDHASNGFTSQEQYFPVFDSTVKDLQSLEADVVQHVAAFYTYMKVMRDTLRKFALIQPPAPGTGHDTEWHRTISSIVYMQFLALESARHAIRELVEYEPTQAEDMITILLSELVAYKFLRDHFQDSLRQGQLKAREPEYRSTFRALRRDIKSGKAPHWERATRLLSELTTRYQDVLADVAPVTEMPHGDHRRSA
jgi:hypothetical protein